MPAHALLEGRDLLRPRPRDRGQRHVPLGEMDEAAVEVIGRHRATGAPLRPFRAEHEVIDDQLAAAVEEVRERLLSAVRPREDIALLDPLPGELAALPAELVA